MKNSFDLNENFNRVVLMKIRLL